MKKRFWSLLLVFSLAFCLLLPISALALEAGRGEDSYAFLKNYLLKNGKIGGGVYTYSGVETSEDISFDITAIYDPNSDQLRFGVSQKQEIDELGGEVTYRAELVVPSALEMPYDASQTVTSKLLNLQNQAKIGADFTRDGELAVTGETHGVDNIPELFANTIALALRHAQDNLFYGSGYTIADLGFTALFQELYGDHTHVASSNNAVPATCTESGFSGDQICGICGEPMGAGEVIPALGHKPEMKNVIETACSHSGYTGDEICSACGEILREGSIIPALAHKTELKNARPATETRPGYTGDEVCTVCGETVKKGEWIPALGPKECDGGKDCPSKIFTDVNQTLWYHLPIDWAVMSGVTTGLTATTFGPDASCTRAQMVTFLWRAAGEPEPTLQSSPFVDVPAGRYYAKAVLWALENGVTTGMDDAHFAPDNTVTRAQTVTFLWRLMNKPAPSGSQSFPDVPAGQYYSEAVAWAVEKDVTNGMGNGRFAPNDNCTRAQIVTFLYRAVFN